LMEMLSFSLSIHGKEARELSTNIEGRAFTAHK